MEGKGNCGREERGEERGERREERGEERGERREERGEEKINKTGYSQKRNFL